MCPHCKSNNIKELHRSKTDNIDNLDHSRMKCNDCGYNFNRWNESKNKLKRMFGENYNLYCEYDK